MGKIKSEFEMITWIHDSQLVGKWSEHGASSCLLKRCKTLNIKRIEKMNKISEEKKKPGAWEGEETKCFLETIKELHVISLMDGKTFKTSEIFKKVEKVFESKGFHKTNTQLLDKFKAMKKRFIAATKALSKSGAGTEEKIKCPFFDELSEIFGYRPTLSQIGIDSTILPPDSDEETSGYYESNTQVSYVPSENQGGSQKRKFVEFKSSCHDVGIYVNALSAIGIL